MARETFVYREGLGVIPKSEAPPLDQSNRAHGVISDEMQAVQSPITGKMHDSKSALRREYRQAGVVEVGNEPVGKSEWGHAARNEAEDRRHKEMR